MTFERLPRGEESEGLTEGNLSGQVIGLPIKVHRIAGPGLLEQIYEDCLCHERARAGLTFKRQVNLPLIYDGIRLPRAYRADIVVGETIILEIKSIERILRVHEAQLQTYLRLSGCRVGLLLNFNTAMLKGDLRRAVNDSSPRSQ